MIPGRLLLTGAALVIFGVLGVFHWLFGAAVHGAITSTSRKLRSQGGFL